VSRSWGKPWTGGGVRTQANPNVIQLGSVVWAPIVPDGGVVKDRRSIVVYPPSANPNDPITVVGVTTDRGRYNPQNTQRYPADVYVEMPYAADGSDATTFTEPCAAKLDTFVQDFARASLRPCGILRGPKLQELLDKLDAP
jgi:hypothetical protein